MKPKTSNIIKGMSILVVALSAILLLRALPMDAVTTAFRQWVEGLGVWGPVAFALVYVVATVCFVPGSILTLLAGAVFGLAVGFVTVSIASIVGATSAFVIARYLARSRVEAMAQSNKTFGALDDAIREGGWKIVGMLRLSPAIPFALQNYLFGLTDIKLVAYVVTSWVAMIPGTFMYVYIGHVAGAATGQSEKSLGEWVLLGVGLLATIGVTIYITKKARQKLNQGSEEQGRGGDGAGTQHEEEAAQQQPNAVKTYGYATSAALLLILSIATQFQKEAIADFFRVDASETTMSDSDDGERDPTSDDTNRQSP